MEVVEGQVLAGKYQIERVLGRGGMGVVVAATHLQLGERVALKFLLPEAIGSAPAVARFNREARAAVKIKSEHVARISDVGTLDNGAPYLVMEYLEGTDLAGWLRQRGPLPIEQAVEFVLQACEAIAEAHMLGIVHRDLKPANLFVIERPDGALSVKVLDFGISKSTGLGSSAAITQTSMTLGSPLYMSPEQMQSAKDVDSRGDIWSLGVVLYELLTGRTPFPGETLTELVLNVVNLAPLPLRTARADVPLGLEAVILRCLEKDRGARYQTIADLAVALLDFAPRSSKPSVDRIGRVIHRGKPAAMTQDASAEALKVQLQIPQTMASWGQTSSAPKHRRRVILIAAALVSMVGVTVAVLRSSKRLDPGVAAASVGVAPRAPGSVDSPVDDGVARGVEVATMAAVASAASPSAGVSEAPPVSTSAASVHRAPGAARRAPKPVAPPATGNVPPSTLPQASPVPTPARPDKSPLKMSIQ